MSLDTIHYPWKELSNACLNLSFTVKEYDGCCLIFHRLLLVTNEEKPVVIVDGRLSKDIILRFLQEASEMKRTVSNTSLIKIREYFDYGWYNGSRVTRIYPVRDFYVEA